MSDDFPHIRKAELDTRNADKRDAPSGNHKGSADGPSRRDPGFQQLGSSGYENTDNEGGGGHQHGPPEATGGAAGARHSGRTDGGASAGRPDITAFRDTAVAAEGRVADAGGRFSMNGPDITRHDQTPQIRPERSGQATRSDAAVVNDPDSPRSISEVQEKFERQQYTQPQGGVGYKFDDRKAAPGELDRWYNSLSASDRQALKDPKTVITLDASASRPGTEAYNQRLSADRGQLLADDLRARGVKAEIRINASGEQAARKGDGVSMSLRAPSDRDKEDMRDDRRYRAVLIDIQHPQTNVEMNPERVDGQRHTPERLEREISNGARIFVNEANKVGEAIRQDRPLEELPFLPDPSKDPKEFAAQVFDVLRMSPLERTVRGGLQGIFESLGVRDQMRQDVADERKPLYEAWARGLASGMDPEYANQHGWSPKDNDQRKYFDLGKQTAEKWSDRELEQVGLFLTLYATESVQSYDHLTNPGPEEAGDYYAKGAAKFFEYGKYWYNEGGAKFEPGR